MTDLLTTHYYFTREVIDQMNFPADRCLGDWIGDGEDGFVRALEGYSEIVNSVLMLYVWATRNDPPGVPLYELPELYATAFWQHVTTDDEGRPLPIENWGYPNADEYRRHITDITEQWMQSC